MNMYLKVASVVAIISGFILLLGIVGSDCDGKCIDNALALDEVVPLIGIGFALIGVGIFGIKNTN